MEEDYEEIIPINNENCEEITGYSPNYFAKLTGIYAYTSSFESKIEGSSIAPRIIIDSTDGKVHMHRTFFLKDKYISNNSFEVSTSNKGIGRTIFNKQVEEAIKENYLKIECIAGQSSTMNGAYTWARFGFVIEDFSKNEVQVHLKQKGYEGSEVDPHLIVKTPEGQHWWKKNGITYACSFSLENDSESMRTFNEYIGEYEEKYYEE